MRDIDHSIIVKIYYNLTALCFCNSMNACVIEAIVKTQCYKAEIGEGQVKHV